MPQFPNDNQKMHMPQGYAEPPTSHHGVVLAIFIIILALVLGALYLWGSELRKREAVAQMPETSLEAETRETDSDLATSDEISSIEADLSATALESLSTDLDTFDAEARAQ